MPKLKKDAKKATFYLSNEVINELEKYCEETGLSKTAAVERFIKKEIELYNNRTKESEG